VFNDPLVKRAFEFASAAHAGQVSHPLEQASFGLSRLTLTQEAWLPLCLLSLLYPLLAKVQT